MQRAIRNGTDIPYLAATYVTITSFGLSRTTVQIASGVYSCHRFSYGQGGPIEPLQLSCLLASPVSFDVAVCRH